MKYSVKTNFSRGNTQAIQIEKEIAAIDPDPWDEFIVDFNEYKEANPFSNLLLITALKRFKREHPDLPTSMYPKSNDGYLEHLGFYQAFGASYGKELGEARASSNYVPITNMKFGPYFYDTVEEKSRELASTLQFDRSLSNMLRYIFQETIRNVYEHAETNEVWIAAQKWPSQNLVEIAIADSGCGIQKSLGRKYQYENVDMIRIACKPGISAMSNHPYLLKDDVWRNSGYGLYALKMLPIMYEGSFLICSGDRAIRYYTDVFGNINEHVYEANHEGTIVAIRFTTNTGNRFDDVLREVIRRGEEEAGRNQDAIKTASKSSSGQQ